MRYSEAVIQVQRTRDDIIWQSFIISILDLDSVYTVCVLLINDQCFKQSKLISEYDQVIPQSQTAAKNSK